MDELVRTHQIDRWSKSNEIRVKNLSVSWSDDREKMVLDTVSFEVDQVQMIVYNIIVRPRVYQVGRASNCTYPRVNTAGKVT